MPNRLLLCHVWPYPGSRGQTVQVQMSHRRFTQKMAKMLVACTYVRGNIGNILRVVATYLTKHNWLHPEDHTPAHDNGLQQKVTVFFACNDRLEPCTPTVEIAKHYKGACSNQGRGQARVSSYATAHALVMTDSERMQMTRLKLRDSGTLNQADAGGTSCCCKGTKLWLNTTVHPSSKPGLAPYLRSCQDGVLMLQQL